MALAGRVGVILGVANKHSLAWTVAQAWHAAGALVTVSCQNERFDKRLEQMVSELAPSPTVSQPACHALCDVANESEVTKLFTSVADRCGRVDMVFHAIANAPTPALKGSFLDTTREDFLATHEVSAYSLVSVARAALPHMPSGGSGSDDENASMTPSITALSYGGSRRAVPGYNVMGPAKASLEASARALALELADHGVRVNCIAPGPLNTLAARGLQGFSTICAAQIAGSPMRSGGAQRDTLAATSVFLASDAASAITGQVLNVDGGSSAVATEVVAGLRRAQ